jgi:hypothetical protein
MILSTKMSCWRMMVSYWNDKVCKYGLESIKIIRIEWWILILFLYELLWQCGIYLAGWATYYLSKFWFLTYVLSLSISFQILSNSKFWFITYVLSLSISFQILSNSRFWFCFYIELVLEIITFCFCIQLEVLAKSADDM